MLTACPFVVKSASCSQALSGADTGGLPSCRRCGKARCARTTAFVQRTLLAIGVAAATLLGARADTVALTPTADTTLIETAPDNNLGEACFFNAGTTGLGTRNRGLLRFDFAGVIPTGALVTSVTLILQVTGEPDTGGIPSGFELHRVLRSWGEGTKGVTNCPPEPSQSPGLGEPAAAGEATWRHRFAMTTQTWATPGGAPGLDYSTNLSASTFVFGADDPIQFEPTPELVADVQFWLNNPGADFGWMLISDSENVRKTARRFGSSEAASDTPRLIVQFIPPPRIERVQQSNSQVQFVFTARAGQTYRVEFRDALANGNWPTLTNIAAQTMTTNVTVFDALTRSQRYYRVATP